VDDSACAEDLVPDRGPFSPVKPNVPCKCAS